MALLAHAHAVYATNHFELALSLYRDALDLAPDDPEINGSLGAMLLQLGDPAAAIPLLQKSVATSPPQSSLRPLRSLAQAHFLSGDHREAIATYERALALAPDTPSLRHEAAITLLDPSSPVPDGAARALDLLQPLLPTARESDPIVLQSIVRSLLALDRADEAAELAADGLTLVNQMRDVHPAIAQPLDGSQLDSLADWFTARSKATPAE